MMAPHALRLANGLRVNLIQQPQATQAAALLQIDAGSHDEPAEWPGLAHLLEHLLFSDSAGFQNEARLMPWVQSVGGRLNATTQPYSSAWFFEVDATLFDEGLQRLSDMLAAPLFPLDAVIRECAVIDAEYQLIKQHTPSRQEAALFSLVAQPNTFHQFHIGSRAGFGQQPARLQQALHQFHQRHFSAGRMTLWLQGPQPLETLRALAEQFAQPLRTASLFSPAEERLTFHAIADTGLTTVGVSQLWLTCYLPRQQVADRDNVTLLREFMLDEAEGGWMAALRQRNLASQFRMTWLNRDRGGDWLACIFDTRQPDALCDWFLPLLSTLAATPDSVQQHYRQLAVQRFAALSPLEQLRERALGFVPADSTVGFSSFLQRLTKATTARLYSSPDVHGELTDTQGFSLPLARWSPQPVSRALPELHFHPRAEPIVYAPQPSARAAIICLPASGQPATLVIRPPLLMHLPEASAAAIARRLRPLIAGLRHCGGEASWQEKQGVWQIVVEVSPENEGWLALFAHALKTESSGEPADPPDDVAIRQLMRQLPAALGQRADTRKFEVVLHGGTPPQQQSLSHWVSLLPLVGDSEKLSAAKTGCHVVSRVSKEHALLLFLPQPSTVSLAALQALALLAEPRFFQQLRTEEQTGYVVSCRYQRCVDRDGLLFSLQSPHLTAEALLARCRRFLQEFSLPNAPEAAASLRARLQERLAAEQGALVAAERALRQRYRLDDLNAEAIDALNIEQLRQAQGALLARWQQGIALLGVPQQEK